MAGTEGKVRVGLIGCGGISGSHLPLLSTYAFANRYMVDGE